MTYFLYLALGDKKYVKEACYAIASLISTNQNTDMPYRIAFMVTNLQAIHPQLAQNELIDIFHISDDIMRDWIGPLGYVYRVKIMAMKMLFACHPDSNIIFIDTDTVILKDLSPLMRHVDNGGFLMYSQCQDITKAIQMTEHVEKSQISKHTYLRIQTYKKVLCLDRIGSDDQFYLKPNPLSFYNSGVIGLNHQHCHLLDDVVKLNDLMVKEFHYGAEEEMAFSWIFQLHGPIAICDDAFVYHYVENKKSRLVIGYYFNMLYDGDAENLQKFLDENQIPSIDIFDLKIEDLPTFIHYILSKKNTAYKELELVSILDSTTYLNTDSAFYRKIMSPATWKNYMKKETLYLKNVRRRV